MASTRARLVASENRATPHTSLAGARSAAMGKAICPAGPVMRIFFPAIMSDDTGVDRGTIVRIAAGQGALGESSDLLIPALEAAADYVVCDSLAEATTSMMALDRRQNEALGFAPDLGVRLDIAVPYVAERGTRLITNAGGVNPVAAHRLAVANARAAGFSGLRIGLVWSDVARPDHLLGREVYLGAAGVVEALQQGADVVITGRVADAALFLAPLVTSSGGRGRTGAGWRPVSSSATCSSVPTRWRAE